VNIQGFKDEQKAIPRFVPGSFSNAWHENVLEISGRNQIHVLCIIATYIAVLTLTSWAPSAGMWDSSVDTYLPQSKGNNRNVTALLSRNFEQRLPAARLYQQLGHACNNIGRLFDAES
jgi:hypothetical protein